MAGMLDAVRRSLPGWSLARDSPKPAKKQGWECPAPTVEDWEDYKKWKEEQERKDELPAAPQFFINDMSLLFYQDPEVQLPWVHRLKCELPRRLGRLSGELPVKASFIGFALEDPDSMYEEFKRAMAQINVVLCRHIHHPPNRFELAHLEQSDLIMVAGGNRRRLWETLGTDLGGSQVAEHVKWRYLQGAVVVAVGEAMSLLGEKSWYSFGESGTKTAFTGWKIFPHIVASETEGVDLEDMVEELGGAGIVILGIHQGCGLILNRDGLVEPVHGMVQEYRWDWQSKSVKQALLLGPPRSTGLLCPLYAARQQRQGEAGEEDDEEVDAWAYALTQQEEELEEQLVEGFEELQAQQQRWLTKAGFEEFESIKKDGNEAFKAGKADHAGIKYEQARVALQSHSRPWSELSEEAKTFLNKLGAGSKDSPATKSKEDYRMTTCLIALLLNICACRLLAHEQDEVNKKSKEQTKQDGEGTQAPAEEVQERTLVEVRDNLVSAFRAANEALRLSNGQSAKAWYRRGCVFERARDPRNALRDLEEALLRAPGDKGITKKRDEVKSAAEKVAETMYYARHKDLDSQVAKLQLESRRYLSLQGSWGDDYADERKEFAMHQPLARPIEGTLQEVDGLPTLLPNDSAAPADTAGGSSSSSATGDTPYLHPHALWTWEFLVQKAPQLQYFKVENVDLGSGPLEWLCKGIRSHKELRVLVLAGAHVGSAGAKMLRNVLAQNTSLISVTLERCGLHNKGLDELAQGLRDNGGQLEKLALPGNYFNSGKLGKLVDALVQEESDLALTDLDLSENPLGAEGARELGRLLASEHSKLSKLSLADCNLDLVAFWRLVGKLDDSRRLAKLDLQRNPIGRGTLRCWRSTMGPTLRCEVLLSDHPLKAKKKHDAEVAEFDSKGFPLPERWV